MLLEKQVILLAFGYHINMQEIRSSKEVQNYKVVSFTKKRYLNTFTQNGVKRLLCPSVPPNFQLFEVEICQEKKHPGVGTATGSARAHFIPNDYLCDVYGKN